MPFDQVEFGFVLHHAKVEAFQIMVGNVVHTGMVEAAARSSQENVVDS